MLFPIEKKFKIRHAILVALQSAKLEENSIFEESESEFGVLSISEITKSANISKEEFISEINYLKSIDHIEEITNLDRRYFYILLPGTVAYYNKTHILEGRKERKEIWDFKINNGQKIIITLIAIISLLINLYQAKNNSDKIKELKIQIEILKEKQ